MGDLKIPNETEIETKEEINENPMDNEDINDDINDENDQKTEEESSSSTNKSRVISQRSFRRNRRNRPPRRGMRRGSPRMRFGNMRGRNRRTFNRNMNGKPGGRPRFRSSNPRRLFGDRSRSKLPSRGLPKGRFSKPSKTTRTSINMKTKPSFNAFGKRINPNSKRGTARFGSRSPMRSRFSFPKSRMTRRISPTRPIRSPFKRPITMTKRIMPLKKKNILQKPIRPTRSGFKRPIIAKRVATAPKRIFKRISLSKPVRMQNFVISKSPATRPNIIVRRKPLILKSRASRLVSKTRPQKVIVVQNPQKIIRKTFAKPIVRPVIVRNAIKTRPIKLNRLIKPPRDLKLRTKYPIPVNENQASTKSIFNSESIAKNFNETLNFFKDFMFGKKNIQIDRKFDVKIDNRV